MKVSRKGAKKASAQNSAHSREYVRHSLHLCAFAGNFWNTRVTAESYAQQIQKKLGETWLPRIYRERILRLRTRSYHFEAANPKARIVIQHTLLGVELKIGRRRLLCPDLATARYLSVFARVGCTDVAVPYDITKISHIADELESSWYRMLLLVEQEAGKEGPRTRSRVRGLLIAQIRKEITAAGAGTRIPEFKKK